ncbi:uncharacterized protein EDB91DRAFT_1253701 [Suillus paluster]|uniref:uncharacterized protein n=1 Tax=Suillus paluster TaxID=48578 RepID=UPI001B87E416|nr:uncharacterized protein EDB91DRAFT_1253701 [Suillus paluster]KAG1727956.1 hypothetical protein EDB91DRAFT_1253701 [Suillus paluster]
MHACHPVAPTQDLPQLHQPPQFLPPPPDNLPPPQSSPGPAPADDLLPPRSLPGPAPADEDPNLPEAQFTDTSERYFRTYHPLLNGLPCSADGVFLLPGTPPTLPPPKSPRDWSPYHNNIEFVTAEFVFKQRHMSNSAMDTLFDLMAAQLLKHNNSPPFADHKDLHKVIDTMQLGNVPWQCLSVRYMGDRPEHDAPPWMDKEYEVWYRDPRLMAHNITRRWKDFMSGDWAWQQADEISEDLNTHGSTFVPIILSSNKTTVSMGTGNNKYYPLYASIRNVHNNMWHAHRDALVIIGFLSIPKNSDALWDEFGIISILVPFTNDFPRADIYQLLSFDLLHQLVKGAFKDHLVDWVVEYLRLTHGTKRGDEIMSDIDHRIAAVASFTGLC